MIRVILLVFALCSVGFSARADEISTFDATIQADLPALDTIFAAFPGLNPSAGLGTSRLDLFVSCSFTDTTCNTAANSAGSAFESLFPGCLNSPIPEHSCFDQNVVVPGMILYSFDVESDDVPANPVPEPATLALLGTGLVGSALMRRKWKH